MTSSLADPAPVIDVRSASFGYAGSPVVSDLQLSVSPGEVVALLGPNGSGKSTVVRGLLGLNDHLGGDIEVLGNPVTRRSDRTPIGYVPQRHTLSASVRCTVREVVSTGRLTHRPWWHRAGARDRQLVAEALDTVGLSDRAKADVATLSGGQQRRVLIARALAGDPSVLIMDEPTAGVDAASQEVLATVMQRLVDRGVTMLIVTHDLSVLHQVVTRIVAMEGGAVTFDGVPADYTAYLGSKIGGHGDHPHARGHHRHDDHHHDEGSGPERSLTGLSDPMKERRRHG